MDGSNLNRKDARRNRNGLNLNRKDARRNRNERKEILTARTQGETAMNAKKYS